MNKNYQKAFTLVELAIVIVIIGLLVGGVLQGQELIKAAKSQRLMKDFQSYEAAYRIFESKYNCLPGDCARATTYFSASSVTNGNGNRMVSYSGGIYEGLRAWNHFGEAKMINGSFTGVATSGTIVFDVGVNVPRMTFDDGVGSMILSFNSEATGSPYGIYGSTRNTIVTGRKDSAEVWRTPFIKPQDAYAFDAKFDDGKASTGKIFGMSWTTDATCTQTGHIYSITSDDYNLANTAISCNLAYNLE